MRSITILAGLASAFLLLGCDKGPAVGGDNEKRMADLEKQVAILKEQNRDVRAKLKASHGFRSPIGDFFASPEFWECTYDSSWSDCSSRCSKQTAAGLETCKKDNPEGPDRVACITKNSTTGSNCLKDCPVQVSPIDPTSCIL